jgi:DNA-binding HxlR family transcriptional regulator
MDILASKSELKHIIKNTISELLLPLKEEVEHLNTTISRDLKLNYLNSIARLLKMEAMERINKFSCSYHITTDTTCKSLLRGYVNQYTDALAMADLAGAYSILTKFEDIAIQNVNDSDKISNCNKDWEVVSSLVNRHREVAREASTLFSSQEIPSDINNLEFSPEQVYEDIIFPFSHKLRLKIVNKLKSGNMRFTDLKNELNVKNTGLLVHHLKPLTEKNLVIQDHRKQYSLSDKGFLIVKYLAQLSESLQPETPITVSLQPLVVLNDDPLPLKIPTIQAAT